MDRRPANPVRPWHVAIVIGLALTAVDLYVLPPGSTAQSAYNNGISLAFIALIAVGIWRYRPADQLTWWLLAGGSLLSISADTVSTGYIATSGEAPFPSFADVLYLAAYPLLFVAIARIGRGAATYPGRERRLDSVIVAMGVLVLAWQPLLGAYAHDSTLGLVGKTTLIAYPVMDIAMLYILLAAVVFNGRRSPSHVLIGLAIGFMLVGDFAYDLLELNATYANGDLIDATWLISYLLLGVAALHPSMADTNEASRELMTPRLWWLMMVGFASFTAPGYLFLGNLLHADLNVAALSGLALVMAMLATIRMKWMFQSLRERAVQLQLRTTSLQEALTERDQLESDLRHQAFHDVLTGLANRALLADRIEHALAKARRNEGVVALVMCDLDGFKTVNDSLGHQAGDALLEMVAKRMQSVVRIGDTVARVGGDEFAALLDELPSAEVANEVATRIVSALREPADLGDETVTVSASVGVCIASALQTAEEILSDADAAMYEAKLHGKNRYVVFDISMRSRVVERLRLTSAFAGAIERCEFYLDYQPCFSLRNRRLRSFEALVRWRHPTLGVVEPMRFIPLAEETGFMLPLGRWILETACREAMSWPLAEDGSPTVAVNVSALQLSDHRFVDDVRAALGQSGLPGERLVLEVTESMLISDKARTVDVLDKLRHMGVRVAIDDFGVGYSSLSQLRDLPVDFVKIDKSFVDHVGDATDDGRAVIDAIIQLAENLNLTTVAEGIELSAQQETLAEMGCDDGQGFLLSRPLDPRAAAVLAQRAALHLTA